VVGRPALKVQKTDGGNLMGTKAWVLSFQIDDQLAHLQWETAPGLGGRGALLVKEACHAFLLKEPGLVVQRAFAGSGFFGTLSRRLSEQDDRAQPFILLLLRPKRIVLDFLPIVGPFSKLPLARRHDDHLFTLFPLS